MTERTSLLAQLKRRNIIRMCGKAPDSAKRKSARLMRILVDQLKQRGVFRAHEFGCLELEQGRTEQALAHFHKAGAAFSEAGVAMAEYTLGHERESQAALGELESKYAVGFSYQIAQAHAWRGERDAAFEWFERAYAQRDAGVTRMRGDPMLAPLRDDPRYAALVRKLNIPD